MKSANQLRKLKRRKHQALNTILVLEALVETLKSISAEEPKMIDVELDKLTIHLNKSIKANDNSAFKSLNAFSKYYDFLKQNREEKINKQIKNSTDKNLTWKSFKELILHLKEEGKSNENIAKEIQKRGAKCNRESIRLFLKKYNEEQK